MGKHWSQMTPEEKRASAVRSRAWKRAHKEQTYATARLWVERNREHVAALVRKSRDRTRDRDPEEYKRKQRDYMRKRYAENPVARERAKARSRRYGKANWLRRKYGLTQDEYAAMFARQDGRCAICRREFSMRMGGRGRKATTACIDHDHATGKVRELLCVPCNLAVGYMQDSPELCRSLAAYLDRHQIKVA